MDGYERAGGITIGVDGSCAFGDAGLQLVPMLPAVAITERGAQVLDWVRTHVDVDPDTIEVEFHAGALRAIIRHGFDQERWRLRIVIRNLGADDASLTAGLLGLVGGHAWVWAAGNAGLVALATDEELGSPWAWRLTRGSLERLGDEVRWLAPGIVVGVADRYVFEMDGGRQASWAECEGLLPAWLPSLTADPLERVVTVNLPDAVVSAPDCDVTTSDGVTTIAGTRRALAEVHGAFGRVDLDLDFPPSWEVVVDRLTDAHASRLLSKTHVEAPRAGHHPLEELGAWMLLWASNGTETPPDVVDLFLDEVEETLDAASIGTLAMAALVVLADREPGRAVPLLDQAVGRVRPAVGMTVALSRAWASAWARGADIAPIESALRMIVAMAPAGGLASLEAAVLTPGREDEAVQALTAMVGGGLPGAQLPRRSDVELAQAVAIGSLIPFESETVKLLKRALDDVSARLRSSTDPQVVALLALARTDD